MVEVRSVLEVHDYHKMGNFMIGSDRLFDPYALFLGICFEVKIDFSDITPNNGEIKVL